jgi:hypothetical protein
MTECLRESANKVLDAPQISLANFGAPPSVGLGKGAWVDGFDGAKVVRERLCLDLNPVVAVDRLLGTADDHRALELVPPPIEGLIRRLSNSAQIAVTGRSETQRRFRLCRGAYLAWRAGDAEDGLVTVAGTRSQQASRAFAAEFLAPAEMLRKRAGNAGLTPDEIDALALEFQCDPRVIQNQAWNHRVPLRG